MIPAHVITNTWLFVEHTNARLAVQLESDDSGTLHFPTVLLAVRKHLADLAEAGDADWPGATPLAQLLQIDPKIRIDPDTVNRLTRYLLYPANAMPQERNRGDWSLQGQRPHLYEVPRPEELFEDIFLHTTLQGEQFATRRLDNQSPLRVSHVSGHYWDEFLDPLSITQGFLSQEYALQKPEEVNFSIQRWMLSICGIEFSNELKHELPSIANHLNQLFYDVALPSRASFHTARSATLSTHLLIYSLQAHTRNALAFYLFLRFTRNLRVRYYWPSSEEDSKKLSKLRRLSTPTQCVSALRSVDHSHLLNRAFGVVSEISGLNFLFKGGILPRVKRGRSIVLTGPPGAGKTVFALQKASSIAKRGGLCVYISFEESYGLVEDRLAAFQFNTPHSFSVHSGPRLPQEKLSEDGMLFFLTGRADTDTPEIDVLANISQIGDLKNWRWRAVVIDSVNALSLNVETSFARRQALQQLVQAIERSGILGILLSEADSEIDRTLGFIADTIIELGQERPERSRWIEIKKCRTQDFHAGRHPLLIQLSRGIRIYPSLSAIRSSLRRRPRSTLSEWRLIPLPKLYERIDSSVRRTLRTTFSELGETEDNNLALSNQPYSETEMVAADALSLEPDNHIAAPETSFIAEKSSTLVYGQPNTGKTGFALSLALSPPTDVRQYHQPRPSTILVVNFRTTERHFEQSLRASGRLRKIWASLKFKRVRWYSPGTNLSAAHIINDIRTAIRDCRKMGLQLERIVFDELENAERSLPRLREEPLFWSTLVDLVGTHAITAIFVYGSGVTASGGSEFSYSPSELEVLNVLRMEVDYVLNLRSETGDSLRGEDDQNDQSDTSQDTIRLVVEKFPDFRLSTFHPPELNISPPSKDTSGESPSVNTKIAVQIDGKVRGVIDAHEDISEQEALAKVIEGYSSRYPGVVDPTRIIYVPGRVISIVSKQP